MNLEETKKIIESKNEAGDLIRKLRSQIKSYVDQKQNLREGFTETFKPLIETQEAVKTIADKEQSAMIKQLQENQKALTEGLEGNRLAITQGFDKMDEVKRSDLKEIAAFEAIEHPEFKETEKDKTEEEKYSDLYDNENTKFKILNKDLYLITGLEKYNKEGVEEISRKDLEELENEYSFLIKDNYEIVFVGNPEFKVLKVIKTEEKKEQEKEDPSKRKATFNDADLDKGLLIKKNQDILKELSLPLPSKVKNEELEVIRLYQNNADELHTFYGNKIKGKANFYTEKGVIKAKE